MNSNPRSPPGSARVEACAWGPVCSPGEQPILLGKRHGQQWDQTWQDPKVLERLLCACGWEW